MTKTELIKDIRRSTGEETGFITKPQVRAYIGKSHETTRKLLEGLTPAPEPISGKVTKKYFVPDVAERIMQGL